MERMSTLDTGFFFVEHKNVPMHIGSGAVVEGPAPAYEDLVGLIAAKLPLVPRYRQVVRTTPLQIFRPVWADDPHFEIGYHVRHAAVPAPGGSGKRGSWRGSRAAAGRSSRRCTTAWWTASAATI